MEKVNEEMRSTPRSKQWFWRNFINTIFMLVMMIFGATPVVTFIICLGLFKLSVFMAVVYALLHFIFSLMLIGVDILRTYAHAAGTKFLYMFVCDSMKDIFFVPMELAHEPEHLNKAMLDKVIVTDAETGEEIELPRDVYTYFVSTHGGDFNESLWLLPRTFYDTFEFHKEASPLKYPVATSVTVGAITRMLTVILSGKVLPVYKVAFAPLFIEWDQKGLPWWNPRTEDVTGAIQSLDNSRALQLEIKLKSAYNTIKSLSEGKEDVVGHGRMIAAFLIRRFLTVFESEEEKSIFNMFGKKFLMFVVALLGLIAVAAIIYLAFFK